MSLEVVEVKIANLEHRTKELKLQINDLKLSILELKKEKETISKDIIKIQETIKIPISLVIGFATLILIAFAAAVIKFII